MSLRTIGPLLCGGLLLLATAASAVEGDPVGGIGVDVETSPGGIKVATTTTDKKGVAKTNALPPGTYVFKVTTGPDAGKVLKTLTIRKAGGDSASVTVVSKGAGVAAK
jgi:hypothetical protein